MLAAAKPKAGAKATPAKETKKDDDKGLFQKIKDNKVKTVVLGFAAYKIGNEVYKKYNDDDAKPPAAKWAQWIKYSLLKNDIKVCRVKCKMP